MSDRHIPTPIVRRALLALAPAVLWTVACGDSVLQIDPTDAVLLRVSVDSANVVIGGTYDIDAFPVDADGALLVGQDVTWTSSTTAIATVDADGMVTGVAVGTANVVADLLGLRDTTVITVAPPPAIALSSDSVGFVAAAGGPSPAPDSVSVTNGGAFDLVVSVDSIVYTNGASGWLTAQVDGAVAPLNLILTPSSSGITATGTSRALVWISGVDAANSPASVEATLRIDPGNAATITLNDGNNQSRTVGVAVTVAPSVLVRDAFLNPAVGATVTFAVTGGGGQITGGSAIVGASGVARVGSWTLGTTAGANQLTASIGILAPVQFAATGTPGNATQVVVSGGNNQSAIAGQAVGVPPSVSVQDQYGNGVTGVGVTFTATAGNGNVTGASQTSGVGGVATVGSWTLDALAGPDTLRATAVGVGAPAVITATGLSGAADSIYATAGNAQTDTVAATLPIPHTVRVVDTNGNGVAGIPITFTTTGGGGSITPSDTTDASGYATAVRVLGTTPGANTASAVVGGLPGSPVSFTATANVGSPAALTVTAGAAQTDTVNQVVPIAPQVRVADKFNNPIQNNLVTFAVTGGGGVVNPVSAIATLSNGTATVTSWQLGTTAGANRDTLTVTATGAGITGNPARIVASSVAGAPTSFTIFAGDGQTAVTGTNVATAPVVRLTDAFGNGVSGRTVNFTTSGGSVGSASPTTGATGQASTTWAVNLTGGTVQANGTFPDTLFANTAGFTQLRVLGSARYSFPTHVNAGILAVNCTSGCHGGGGSSAGMVFDVNATTSWNYLVNVAASCDPSLPVAYRRVSSAGGIAAAETYSILIRKLDPNFGAVGTCGAHSGGEFANGAPQLAILHAWIRNGAPNN